MTDKCKKDLEIQYRMINDHDDDDSSTFIPTFDMFLHEYFEVHRVS